MSLVALSLAALIVTAGALVQTVVGFGMGMVSIPLLLWAGFPLPSAVALTVGAALVQLAIGTHAVRAEVVWRESFGYATFQALAVPVGLGGMSLLASQGPVRVKQFVGLFLLVVLAIRQLAKPQPREEVARIWGVVAATCSGGLAGLVGMGGPPLVLFALAHRWSVDRFRAFLWSQFLLVVPVMVVMMTLRFGVDVLPLFAAGLALAPCSWVGARIGFRLTERLGPEVLRRAALGLLYLLAFFSSLAPLMQHAGG